MGNILYFFESGSQSILIFDVDMSEIELFGIDVGDSRTRTLEGKNQFTRYGKRS